MMKFAWVAALAFAMAAATLTTVMAQNPTQDFVELHNAARREVGVPPVSWDTTVAAYAESYAAQRQGDCALKHSEGGPYGENLAAGPAGVLLPASEAVGMWVDEKQYYDYDTNSCSAPTGPAGCGHYKAVVWRNTTSIGCARVSCNNGGVFVICSYDPRGNFDGVRPY